MMLNRIFFNMQNMGQIVKSRKKKLEIFHSVATRKFWQHTTNFRYDFLPCCLILSVDFLYYFSKQIIKKTKYSDSTKTKKFMIKKIQFNIQGLLMCKVCASYHLLEIYIYSCSIQIKMFYGLRRSHSKINLHRQFIYTCRNHG